MPTHGTSRLADMVAGRSTTSTISCRSLRRPLVTATIAVTGAAGFIGRNVVSALDARGHRDILLSTTSVRPTSGGTSWPEIRRARHRRSPDGISRPTTWWTNATIVHMVRAVRRPSARADYLVREQLQLHLSGSWSIAHGADGLRLDARLRRRVARLQRRRRRDPDLEAATCTASQADGRPVGAGHGHLDSLSGSKLLNVYGPYEEHKGDMRSLVSPRPTASARYGRITLVRTAPSTPTGKIS